jgi:uncharacterized protein (TIGR02246 family)
VVRRGFSIVLAMSCAGLILGTGCGSEPASERESDLSAIRGLIDSYEEAVNAADATKLESLFWLDDSRFSEVENDRPMPFGSAEFLAIAEWIREHGEPGLKQKFHESDVHLLSPSTAYSVSMRDEYVSADTLRSRVTFVYLKDEGEWRIIHAHFSYVPQ